MKKIPVALAGGTGYSGQELEKLLKHHPHFEITDRLGRDFDPEKTTLKSELAFLCTPHELSMKWAPSLLKQGLHVVDLSGAFRLKKYSYGEWYGFEHTHSELLKTSLYGLYPLIKTPSPAVGGPKTLVSNPGCYATSVLCGLAPLLMEQLIDPSNIVVDAKSGTTGAGRKADTGLLFSEVYGDIYPYRVGRHQHTPEILETLGHLAGVQPELTFVTSLLPVDRGISSHLFVKPKSGRTVDDLLNAYKKHLGQDSQIKIGQEGHLAHMKPVVGSNGVQIYVEKCFHHVLIVVTIDNLLRGAAGQALMNANQLYQFQAHLGL